MLKTNSEMQQKKLVVIKEKCTSLDEVEAKHIIEYDITFQRLKAAELGIHKIQVSWREWKRDGDCPYILSPQKITLRF